MKLTLFMLFMLAVFAAATWGGSVIDLLPPFVRGHAALIAAVLIAAVVLSLIIDMILLAIRARAPRDDGGNKH